MSDRLALALDILRDLAEGNRRTADAAALIADIRLEEERGAPLSVADGLPRDTYAQANRLRSSLKVLASVADDLRRNPEIRQLDMDVGANITLAYRHLEDASMRLGKALQALDGGVSVYDRKTTVGA